jgi:phosphinothricin acetyltransferase
MVPINITPLTAGDWPQVADIYAAGIATRLATFETRVPAWDAWDRGHLPFARLAARAADRLVGWAALSPFSSRQVYAGVAEVSVYVADAVQGQGVGRRLLTALIAAAEEHGVWTLQARIFPENEASVTLHQKLGFRIVGRRERLARLDGVWRDVLLLERRSHTVGIEEVI